MKILFLNTFDITGGAAKAVCRLLKGLQQKNEIQAQMLVQSKKSDDYTVLGPEIFLEKVYSKIVPILDYIPLRFYKKRKNIIFSSSIIPTNVLKKIKHISPDIVHINWITAGFMKIESISRIKEPIIWTLHDSWAFTGGCHIPFECKKYSKNCGCCPILNSNNKNDLSYKNWKRKKKSWENLDLTIVSPSSWLGECAKKSSLFNNKKICVIPNGLDLSIFKPIDKYIARDILNLPKDNKLVLFGAMNAIVDKNKGFHLLKEALRIINPIHNNLELLIFGSSKPKEEVNLNIKTRFLGQINDELSLSLIYSSADVMVVPSIQETFSQTAVESLACGTPVVAFNSTGPKDIIEHKINGYLAIPFDTSDLANGIQWVLEDNNRLKQLGRNAREKATKCFDINIIARKYIDLYEKVLNK